MTNRHVVERIDELQVDLGFPDTQRMLLFVTVADNAQLRPVVRMVRAVFASDNRGLDIAFVEFQRQPEQHFVGIAPLKFEERYSLHVTEDIAVCGYPYGEAMLQRDRKVYRWGPVIQQGHVSAVSPFDGVPKEYLPNELLLDVRIAAGMSGGPIVRPRDGRVVGIVHSAWESTTALGLPLITAVVDGWLLQYDESVSRH